MDRLRKLDDEEFCGLIEDHEIWRDTQVIPNGELRSIATALSKELEIPISSVMAALTAPIHTEAASRFVNIMRKRT